MLYYNSPSLYRFYNHPFNTQLFNGTLPPHVFGKFLQQDIIYLNEFALRLERIALRLESSHQSHATQLKSLALDIITCEQKKNSGYLRFLDNTVINTPANSAVLNYVNHLHIQSNHQSLPVAIASFLPCFWFYYQLGKKGVISDNNPYSDWIATYYSREFVSATLAMVEIMEDLGKSQTLAIRGEMGRAFSQSGHFESGFLDAVYYENKIKNVALPEEKATFPY